MKMQGERQIAAPRSRVWAALNDPEVLKRSIPGCERIDKLSPTAFEARVVAKVGPVSAGFTGAVNLSELKPPESYRISGSGKGGPAGFASGGARVRLEAKDGGTLLSYDVDANVGGRLAQIGSRLIDSTARKMADQFFTNFAKVVESNAPIAGELAETAAPAKAAAKKAAAKKAAKAVPAKTAAKAGATKPAASARTASKDAPAAKAAPVKGAAKVAPSKTAPAKAAAKPAAKATSTKAPAAKPARKAVVPAAASAVRASRSVARAEAEARAAQVTAARTALAVSATPPAAPPAAAAPAAPAPVASSEPRRPEIPSGRPVQAVGEESSKTWVWVLVAVAVAALLAVMLLRD